MLTLIPKQYEVNIVIPKRILFFRYKKIFKLKYQTATLWESMVYEYNLNQDSNHYISWFINFIIEKSGKKIRKSDTIRIWNNILSVVDILNKTYFPQKEDISFPKSNEDATTWAPFSSYIVWIAKSLNMDPIDMAKKYTQEQIDFLLLWLARNTNEITDDGKKRNSAWVSEQENKILLKEKWEEIQAIFKQLIKE